MALKSTVLLRIAHANYARGEVRGGERQLALLVEQLSGLGHEQLVVCRKGSGLESALANIPNVALAHARHHLLDGLWSVGADILHAHDAKAAYWAAFAGWRFRKPYVITRRVLNPISKNWLSRRVYTHSAATVGVSEAVCNLHRAEFVRSSSCIHDAHQSLTVRPATVETIRRQVGGGPIIGQVAALVDWRKGQSAAISAFEIIKRRFPDARLVFLGKGPDEAMLRERAAGIEGILFAGYQEDIGNWTAAFDLVMLPSTRDALASSLLDAMGLGVPVVANRVGGIPEIARDGVSALLVERGDVNALAQAAMRIFESAELRSRLIAGGKEVARATSASVMADRYLQLYDALANGSAPTPAAA